MALAGGRTPELQTAGLQGLLQQPEAPKAPTIKPFATGEKDAQGNPMFQDRGFIGGSWFDMGAPYPKRGGVTVNTGDQLDPFVQKYGEMESGMMRNPDFDESKPLSRTNAPYISQPLGSKDPYKTNQAKGQLFLDTADKMQGTLNQYRDILNRTGATLTPGPAQMELSSAYGQLQLEYKELAALGVLAGPDMALIERVLTDPTTLRGKVLEQFGGIEGYMRQLDLVEKKLEQGRASARKNLMGQPWDEKRTLSNGMTVYKINGEWYDNPEGK